MGSLTRSNYTLTEPRGMQWLKLQAGLLTSATRGCLYLFSKSKSSASVSEKTFHWPAKPKNGSHFHQVCNRAEEEGKGVVLTFKNAENTADKKESYVHIAFPVTLADDFMLVSAFELHPQNKEQLHQGMQKLEWGLCWLKEELLNPETINKNKTNEIAQLLEIHTAVQEQTSFSNAAQRLVDDLARILNCERVCLGLYKKKQMDVVAISHQTNIDTITPFVRDIALAMEECYDQNTPIYYPAATQHPGPITKLHEALAVKHGVTSVLSLPITGKTEIVSLTLLAEKSSATPVTSNNAQLSQNISQFIGPVLISKLLQESSLAVTIFRKMRLFSNELRENRNGKRLKALGAVSLLIFCVFAKGNFHIDADVTLSGTIVRDVIAPFPGYVAKANKSAGDHVEKGEVLASLDMSDLTLERLTWRSKYTQADLEYRKAVASGETSQAKIISQQKKQAELQLSLLDIQEERAIIKAPFSGMIVTGDLSQSVGGPVERGKLLFEMVPTEGFKILAQVDEKDISFIEKGQAGTLIFNSLPKDTFQFSLSKITPVSTAAAGHNSFRVEAILDNTSERLRPGMKGFGKITIGKKPFIWIWTRSLRERIRLLGWKMLP